MRQLPTPCRALRFVAALALLTALVVLSVAVGCGPNQAIAWICLNPVTGKEDPSIHDENNFFNGQPDPCHCYDACGPAKTCPIVVDAGAPSPGCDGGP